MDSNSPTHSDPLGGPHIAVVVPVRNDPAHLRACLRSLQASTGATSEIIVVDDGSTDDTPHVAADMGAKVVRQEVCRGPAVARNRGAREATAPIVLFIDADVCVHPDTLSKLIEDFRAEPDVAAVFGSYDDAPSETNIISQYKNLTHHFVHQQAKREASTFWSGCGAVRRDIFLEMGGFDENYPRPCIEDIELGTRLRQAGRRIILDRDVQATHLKRWTLWGMIKSDVFDRAIPWTRVIVRDRYLPNDLNVGAAQRISAMLVGLLVLLVIWGSWVWPPLALLTATCATGLWALDAWSIKRPIPWWMKLFATAGGCAALVLVAMHLRWWTLLAAPCLFGVVVINRTFYSFLARTRGPFFTTTAFPLHLLYYIYSSATFAGVVMEHLSGKAIAGAQEQFRRGADGRPGVLARYTFLLGADAASKLMGFTVTVLIARKMGDAAFGAIGLATSAVLYAIMTSSCGSDVYAVRSIAAGKTDPREMAGIVIALRVVFGLIVYALLMAVTMLVAPLRQVAPLIAIAGLSCFSMGLHLGWLPQALQRTRALAITNLGTQGFFLGFVLIALSMGGGFSGAKPDAIAAKLLWTIPAAQVAAELLVALGLLIWAKRTVGWPKLPSLATATRVFKDAMPIGGSQILRSVALGSDALLLGFFVALNYIGWYNGAYKLYLLMLSGTAIYFVILLPRLSERVKVSAAAVRQEVMASLARTLPLAVLPLLGIGLLAAPLLARLYHNTSFAAGALSLQVLLVALLFTFISSHFRNALLAQGRQHQDLRYVLIATITHVVLKLALIPTMGIAGAAIGTCVGEGVLALLGARAVLWPSEGRDRSDEAATNGLAKATA
jgi:O-antigen/teichoic acid export membrane protein